jgi:hypothetical protein
MTFDGPESLPTIRRTVWPDDSGEVLRIFDDSMQFESFSIQPGNIFV